MLSLASSLALAADGQTSATYFLKQQRGHEIVPRLNRVSDPSSPDWGNFLTHDEVQALQAPLEAHVELVDAHLRHLGATDVTWSTARDKAVATLPAGSNAVLLPDRVRAAVDFVSRSAPPRASPPKERRAEKTRPKAAPPAGGAKPDPQECLYDKAIPPCLRKAYGLNETSASATDFNAQAVIVNQGYKASDLAAFEREHGLPSQKVVKEVGKNTGEAGDEATLDVQFIIGMGQMVPTWWVYIDGHTKDPFASWITWASNTSQIPYVHSLSVGEPEGGCALSADRTRDLHEPHLAHPLPPAAAEPKVPGSIRGARRRQGQRRRPFHAPRE